MAAITKWEPFSTALRSLEDMSTQLEKMLTLRPFMGTAEEALTVAEWTPAVDIKETEKEYLIKAEIPEVNREDVKVSVEEGVLTLKGERHKEKEEKNEKIHRIERSHGSFLRSFTMPLDADEAKVSAEFKNGMLFVHLPKTEKAKPKAIDIKIA